MPSALSPRILGHSDFGDYERRALSKGHNATLNMSLSVASRLAVVAVSSALMHYNSDVPRRQVRDDDLKKDIHTGCSSSYKNGDICSFDVFKYMCQVLCPRTHWLSHNFVVTK